MAVEYLISSLLLPFAQLHETFANIFLNMHNFVLMETWYEYHAQCITNIIYLRLGHEYAITCIYFLRNIFAHSCRNHDDVIKWKHFPRYWPFVRGIHRSPVNSPHKGQWRGALIFSLICVWINVWETIVRLVIWDAIAAVMTSLYVCWRIS